MGGGGDYRRYGWSFGRFKVICVPELILLYINWVLTTLQLFCSKV